MKKFTSFLTVLVFLLSFTAMPSAFASEGNQMKGSHAMEGKSEAAIDGNCPVCLKMGKVVMGSPKFSTEYEGKVYYFPGFEQQKMFINDPEAYITGLEKKYKELKEQSKGSDTESGSYKGSH